MAPSVVGVPEGLPLHSLDLIHGLVVLVGIRQAQLGTPGEDQIRKTWGCH